MLWIIAAVLLVLLSWALNLGLIESVMLALVIAPCVWLLIYLRKRAKNKT